MSQFAAAQDDVSKRIAELIDEGLGDDVSGALTALIDSRIEQSDDDCRDAVQNYILLLVAFRDVERRRRGGETSATARPWWDARPGEVWFVHYDPSMDRVLPGHASGKHVVYEANGGQRYFRRLEPDQGTGHVSILHPRIHHATRADDVEIATLGDIADALRAMVARGAHVDSIQYALNQVKDENSDG